MSSCQKIRRNCFISQGGNCYYCQQPMWHDNVEIFCREHHLTHRQARLLCVTAEHLNPKSNGGKNSKSNVVAACYFCNTRRHMTRSAVTPERHLEKVRGRMAEGKWHGMRLKPIAV